MAMECTELQGSGLRIEVARASAARGEDIGVRGVKADACSGDGVGGADAF